MRPRVLVRSSLVSDSDSSGLTDCVERRASIESRASHYGCANAHVNTPCRLISHSYWLWQK